jgi:hypothetical protein
MGRALSSAGRQEAVDVILKKLVKNPAIHHREDEVKFY